MNLRWKRTKELAQVFCKMVKEEGAGQTMRRAAGFAKRRLKSKKGRFLPSAQVLERQRAADTASFPVISICVPLYNTPMPFLKEMAESVLAQSCPRWELCLADASNDGDARREEYLNAIQDKRIRYVKIENRGIAENTNEAARMASGSYLALLDHDDVLSPNAVFEMGKAIQKTDALFLYSDEALFFTNIKNAHVGHFKPDFAPDTLRSNNYICHFSVFKRELIGTVGKFDPKCDGSQDFDMILRLTEKAKSIVHIPKILYFWRAHSGSVAENLGAKPYVIEAAHRALNLHLKRIGLEGEVLDTTVPSMYRIKYKILKEDKISIIIPNQDHLNDLKNCLESIFNKTTYPNFEIIIVENNSKTHEIFNYYNEIQAKWNNIKVVYWKDYFNYSAINNFGSKFCSGKYLLLLNNDTEVISPNWIEEMLMFAQRKDVGAVGAKLYYPDNTIQHAGIAIGLLTLAGHLHRNFPREHPGYMGRLIYAQDLNAVTAACMMVPKKVWDEVGGLDESFEVAFNDVDLCMRIRKAGYLIVWTPYAELYHYESKSRGLEDTPEKRKRFKGEVQRFHQRWAKELAEGDPYYNPNFSLDREDFSLR